MTAHHATSLNLAGLLDHQAVLGGGRVAVTCGDTQITYAQLNEGASRIAAGLDALGIAPGQHVALSCPNVPWFPMAYYGILKAGAVVVPLNVMLKPREIAYHLKDSDAVAHLAFEGTPELPMAQMARAACEEAQCRRLVVITADPASPNPLPPAPGPLPGETTLGQVMHGHAAHLGSHRRRPDDTAVILYTSGTTGRPKGAELTHSNMVTNAVASHDMLMPVLGCGPDQIVTLITLPLFHSTAQTCQMNAGVYGGLRMVLHARFDPAAVLETMRRERVSLWIAVPTMYWSVLEYVESQHIDPKPIADYLSVCVSGGAPMPVDVLRRFEAMFGARILEGYGLSETAPVVCFNQLQRPTKPGTVGLPIAGVEVRCLDDEGRPVPAGDRGEVVVRGPNVMKGYYNRPDATEEATRQGWFHTGDIGVLDADGYLAIVDRKKDMILRGGYNVYPRELEEVILTHPAVSQVAVIGVPDDRLGEEVKAFIVRRADTRVSEGELIDWFKDQFASYKYPRLVEFRDALPVGPTGKILKRALKEQ